MLASIQSLWIGPRLSTMERLSISSYLYHGHQFHLYVYGEVADIPRGTVVKDASAIVPASDIRRFQSLANFSDWFRYHLLFMRGGWWVDLDTVCLRPFDFEDEHVFVEQHPDDRVVDHLCAGWIKAPLGSSVMRWCIEQCRLVAWETMEWSALGPYLITKAVKEFSLPYQPCSLFNPITKIPSFINGATQIPEGCFSVHLGQSAWSGIWTGKKTDKDSLYLPGSIYEQLKRKYLFRIGAYDGVKYEKVTLVVLSSGNHDMLRRTLDSFEKQNTYPIEETFVGESSDFKTFPIGTPWVFYLEDGWLFTSPGFIEESMSILKVRPDISTVSLRGVGPDKPSRDFDWNGDEFDHSPGLWWSSDYRRFRDERMDSVFRSAVLSDVDFVRRLGNIR